MSLTFNSKTYTLDVFQGTTAQYASAANTFTLKDLLKLSRTAPKVTATSGGVSKHSSKFTRTLALTGQPELSRDPIIEIGSSLPVGASPVDIDALCADIAAYVGSASFKTALKTGQLSF